MGVIARQSIKGTVVTYLGVFVGFLTTFFVLTRFLSAEEIGLARVLIDTGTLFIGLAQLGTSSSIIRFFPYFKVPSSKDSQERVNHNGFFFWTVI
ncbi:MAG: polysaccharide biosynthesis protein, partial [Paludibacteraceae bacterium]|nr:polysaccharide biosynthesis protein [Paludibacteraceae bacterium]